MERKHKGLNHLITLEVSNNGQFNEVRLHIPPHRKLGHSDQNYPELEWPHLAVVQRLGTGPTSLWYRDWELVPPRCGTETGNKTAVNKPYSQAVSQFPSFGTWKLGTRLSHTIFGLTVRGTQ